VEIYIAFLAGSVACLVLGAVYLADRWEREPVDRIQNYFLSGLLVQLVVLLSATAAGGVTSWSGPWLLLTTAVVAAVLPFQLARESELDEAYDGVVYAVATAAGAVCVIHLNNLPLALSASPYGDALAGDTQPDLRDLLIVTSSPGMAAELGSALVLILAAVVVGAGAGFLLLREWRPLSVAAVAVAAAATIVGVDLLADGWWIPRALVAVAAMVLAAAVKRRSRFRTRPEASESDLVVLGVKTVLVIFGAALLSAALLGTVGPSSPVGFETVDEQVEGTP
jgi:hypothetical protein